jgi:hypothetical protein
MGFLVQKIDLINYFMILFIISAVFLFAMNEYRKIPEDVEDIKLDEIKKIIFLYGIIAIISVAFWEFLLDFINIGFNIVGMHYGQTKTDF